jgi:hypothetical protein
VPYIIRKGDGKPKPKRLAHHRGVEKQNVWLSALHRKWKTTCLAIDAISLA